MPVADLQGPLDDFLARLTQIKLIVTALESAASAAEPLTTTRPGIDLSTIGAITGNTVNAMSIVFLASSFEEFVRDEIIQCSGFLADRYRFRPDPIRHKVRNAYWDVGMQRLARRKSILVRETKVPDIATITAINRTLTSIQRFVVSDDATPIEPQVVVHHRNNFRPEVVDEIAGRLGISNLLERAADSAKIKMHFGVATKKSATERLRLKLSEFYDRRNETVHSLNSAQGFAANVILDYLALFELTAESIRTVLCQELATW